MESSALKNKRTADDVEFEISEILSAMDCNETIKKTILRVPGKYRLQYARALSSPSKKALAIKMKCYECVGFESVSERVRNCNCRLCPLWLHRPFQNANDQIEE